MTVTETAALSFVLIGLCDGGGSSSPPPDASTGIFSCFEYQVMIDVEIDLGGECIMDSQCEQIVPGTGVGCATDDVVLRIDFDSTYLFDLVDEAEAAGCSPEFDTTGDCPAGGEPACVRGRCAWE